LFVIEDRGNHRTVAFGGDDGEHGKDGGACHQEEQE
jgi:hypothetical protein